jgi:hypothetical protein
MRCVVVPRAGVCWQKQKSYVPIELRGSALRNLFRLAVACLLGDVNLLVLGRRLGTAAVVLVDADLFLDVCLLGRVLRGRRGVVVVDRGRDVFVRLFVTFPPVCSRFRKGSFAFYLVWSVLGRCVSIRRREDTEGDRNLGAVSRGGARDGGVSRESVLVLQNPVCRSTLRTVRKQFERIWGLTWRMGIKKGDA